MAQVTDRKAKIVYQLELERYEAVLLSSLLDRELSRYSDSPVVDEHAILIDMVSFFHNLLDPALQP
jgi:hypothetical protein